MRRIFTGHGAITITAWTVILFLLLPSLIALPIAFGNVTAIIFPPRQFGIELFQRFFTEPGWVKSALISLRVAIFTTLLSLSLGIPAAYALVRGQFPGKNLLSLFLLGPIMVPGVVISLALYIYFAKIGLRNGDLRLILGHMIMTLPFVIIMTSSGMRQVDPALENSATIMGASRLTVFLRITVPLIKSSVIASALFCFLLSFDEIVVSWFVARPDTITLPVRMLSSIQWEASSILAAISTMLTVISIIACLAVTRATPEDAD